MMRAEIKSELRKLVTVRSTYFILLLAFILELIFAFWANGVKVDKGALLSPFFLQSQIVDAASALGLIGAFVGVLLVTHEYRYNTIMYTLTASSRRYKVLVAKIIVISIYALLFTVVTAALSPLLAKLGIAINGAMIVPQQFVYHEFVWQILFYGWGFSMIGLALALLIRNQVGTFASLLLLPGLAEQLLGLVLKKNSIYLPFSSLDAVIHPIQKLGNGKAALVFMIYLVVAWAATVFLFQKRDAN